MRGQITHTSLRSHTGVKTSSAHMKLKFDCISKRPNILMETCRHFISSNVYMTFYHPKWNFIFVKMTDIKSIPALSFKRTCTLNATSNWSENLSRFEISFHSKWSIWNPYRFEFHFASIHVNTNKKLRTPKWDFQLKWNLILIWVHFTSRVNVL